MPTSGPAASKNNLPELIESLLFVADEPVTVAALSEALGVSVRQVKSAIETLSGALESRGIRLQRVDDERVQLVTAPEAGVYVERFLGAESDHRLSNAALEVLAVIAYQQPVTRSVVDAIRGVNSDRAIATLRARGLVEEAGRAAGMGRPTLWRTTARFLEYFGLSHPQELPSMAELGLNESVPEEPVSITELSSVDGAAERA